MSSSTSSSRAIFLRIFLVVALGMGVCMGAIRLFALANDVGSDTLMRRVQEARAHLPDILEAEEDLVMAFGSSMTRAGFSARQFDRQMAEKGIQVKSYNFGFGGLNPYFQDYLTRRIRDAFEAEDRRLKLALVEFVPFQVTTRRFEGAQPVIDSFLTLLATPEEVWEIAKKDPVRGFQIANIRYIRDNISAEMITHEVGGFLRPDRPRSSLPEDEEAQKRLEEVSDELTKRFEEDYPDYDGEDWHFGWQGAGTIPEERSASTLELFHEYFELQRTPRRLENARLRRIACCDIEELHFEEELVAAFIRIVQSFQQFSDHVEVVLLPRNTKWIHYSPDASARLSAVLDRIRQETGVTIRNDQTLPGFPAETFSDATHLARYLGDVPYTKHLVEVYAPVLEN